MLVVASGLVLVALPIFMVGGLAVQIRGDLGFDEAGLGAAVTIGFLVGALSGPLGGRLADRLGPRSAIRIGAMLAAASMLGLGLVVESWSQLTLFLCVAGLGIALTDPGLAILVDRVVPSDRQGLAFGVKEASIPAATLLAGLAVPAIALTAGWRWSFALGAIPLAVVVIFLPRVAAPADKEPTRGENPSEGVRAVGATHRLAVFLAGVGGALGVAAASGVGVFLTESAVAMGMSPGGAGFLLAAGSIAGIIARVSAGIAADRIGGIQFRLISMMLAIGAVATALGGAGSSALLVVGTIGAFTAGWAWTGIFFLSLIKTNPTAPGRAAGIGTFSLGIGNASGPFFFGLIAQSSSFEAAWVAAGAAAGVGSLFLWAASRRT
jgi:predicted MFS family arabinose efflux permease